MGSSEHQRSDHRRMSEKRSALSVTRTRSSLPSRHVKRCAIGGGREDAHRREELLEIIADAVKQRILRR